MIQVSFKILALNLLYVLISLNHAPKCQNRNQKHLCMITIYIFLSISYKYFFLYINCFFFKRTKCLLNICCKSFKIRIFKRAPDDKKFKFKTCFSTLCPIQITFVEKVRIEMFCKKELLGSTS